MVGHQTIGAEAYSPMQIDRLDQHLLKRLIVSIILEQLELPRRAVHHMIRQPAGGKTGFTGHSTSIPSTQSTGKADDPLSSPRRERLMTPFPHPR